MARGGFRGQAEYERRLAAIPQKLKDAIAQEQEKIAAEHAARLAVNVPKGPPERGHIVEAIQVVDGYKSLQKIVRIGNRAYKYAAPLEFGHRNKDGSRAAPVKFFFPLARVMKRKYNARVIRVIRKILRGK